MTKNPIIHGSTKIVNTHCSLKENHTKDITLTRQKITKRISKGKRRFANKIIRQNKIKFGNGQLTTIEENFRSYNTNELYKIFSNQLKGYITHKTFVLKKPNGKIIHLFKGADISLDQIKNQQDISNNF